MSELRHKTIRKKIGSRVSCTTTCDEKIRTLRALYIMLYNQDRSIIPLTTELFHVLGEVLEGVPPEQLELRGIDQALLLATIEDLSN